MIETDHKRVDAVVVGAGFAGLYAVYKLRQTLGTVQGFEGSPDVGGTWYLNRYPGARCDTESVAYCYSFDDGLLRDWKWSGKYPQQREILAYLNYVADRFGLRDDIRCNTTVTAAVFDEASATWEVRASDGSITMARYLVMAVGFLAAAPYTPAIPGLASFPAVVHTGAWPQEGVDLTGKRVGVIGTGSSAVQSIPEFAKHAASVTVFQRRPHYIIPAHHGSIDANIIQAVETDYRAFWERTQWSEGGYPWDNGGAVVEDLAPEELESRLEALWAYGGMRFVYGSFADLLIDETANRKVADFIRRKVRALVDDPELADKLTPESKDPLGATRPIVADDYYESFNRPHVHLVDGRREPIETVIATGVKTTERDHDLDLLVLATGFDAFTGPYARIDVHGRGGRTLRESWETGPSSFLGLAVAGFPNMFTVVGPGSTFGNYPVAMEHSVNWIADAIEYLEESANTTIEANELAEREWMAYITAAADKTVVGQVDSWFNGGNIPGKPRSVMFFMGRFSSYRRRCARVAAEGYTGFTLSGPAVSANEPHTDGAHL